MKYISKNLLFCLLLSTLLLSSNRIKIYAQSTLKIEIKTLSDIDICGNKSFQIYVQTDELYAVDSIVGFDLYIGYNDKKIQIDQLLTSGTLSSPLQNSGSDAFLTMNKTISGEVWISGVYFTNNKFLKGKQPLIALSGRYLDNCSDTTLVRLLEFIPAYYNFTKTLPIIESKNLLLKADIGVTSGKVFETFIDSNTYTLSKNDSVAHIPISLKNGDKVKTKNVELYFITNKNNILNIKSVKAIQQGITIDSSYRLNDTLCIRASWKDSIDSSLPSLIAEISRSTFDNDTVNMFVYTGKLTDCNCVTSIVSDSSIILLEGIKVSVDSDNILSNLHTDIIKINELDNSLVFTCEDGSITNVRVFNSLGEEIWNQKYWDQIVSVPYNMISFPISFIEVTFKYKNIETKKLIKYIK